MKKTDMAGLIAGISFLVLGIVLLVISFFAWFVIFYALFCIGVGIALLLNAKKADEIEQIKWKDIKGKKGRK